MALLQIAEPGQSPQPHQRRLAVGIDLGTTNSLVAALRSGIAEPLADAEGQVILPSAVRYHADRVEVGALDGDLWAEAVAGGVTVERGAGDARLSDIGGPVALQTLAGDLRGHKLAAGLTAGRISGDALLSGPFPAGSEYALVADGDIFLSLPANADVLLAVRAGGRIRSDLALTPNADGSPTFSATLGQGACRILLTARGDVRIAQEGTAGKARTVRDEEPLVELGNLGERIRRQVAASLAAAGINIETGERSWAWSYGRRGRGAAPPPDQPKPPAPPATQAPGAAEPGAGAVFQPIALPETPAEEPKPEASPEAPKAEPPQTPAPVSEPK